MVSTRRLCFCWGVALVLAGACGPPTEPPTTHPLQQPPGSDPEPVSEALRGRSAASGNQTDTGPDSGAALGFTADVEQVLAQRRVQIEPGGAAIALRRRGAVRLRADGPDLGLADDKPFPSPARYVVIEDTDRPRLVVAGPALRLMVYVEREDAHALVATGAALHSAPDGAADTDRGHIRLHPGALVEVLEERGDFARVAYRGGGHEVSGWIIRSSLSTTATQKAVGEGSRSGWITTEKTKLTETPGGRALIALAKERELEAIDERPGSDHMLVEYFEVCSKDYSYIGYVRRRSVASPQTGFGYLCGGGSYDPPRPWGDAKSAPRVRVAAGRFVLDADGQVIVGCTLQPVEMADLGKTYAVATPWGPLPVTLAPEDFDGTCGG